LSQAFKLLAEFAPAEFGVEDGRGLDDPARFFGFP